MKRVKAGSRGNTSLKNQALSVASSIIQPHHDEVSSPLILLRQSATKNPEHKNLRAKIRSTTARRPLRRSRSQLDRKSTRLNSSHQIISYAVFYLKKKKQ